MNISNTYLQDGMTFTFKKICGHEWCDTERNQRFFRSAFGCSPPVALQLFVKCNFPSNYPTYYFFVALYFLKTYVTLDVMEMTMGISRKTILKHVWYVIEKMAEVTPKVVRQRLVVVLFCFVLFYSCCKILIFFKFLQFFISA